MLAEALYVYNLRQGFSTRRRYFHGQCFAIRRWSAPTLEQLRPRLARLPRRDNFYRFGDGLRVDDVYLSRLVLHEHGPAAIREVPAARVHFRPAETLAGMYRYYKRMRREIERLDLLFPEMRQAHRLHGRRRTDLAALGRAPGRERRLWRLFQAALWLCRAWYHLERFYYRRLSRGEEGCPTWEPIRETKVPIEPGSIPRRG
jgi:hypothetical protein